MSSLGAGHTQMGGSLRSCVSALEGSLSNLKVSLPPLLSIGFEVILALAVQWSLCVFVFLNLQNPFTGWERTWWNETHLERN